MRWKLAQDSYIGDALVAAGAIIDLPPIGRDRKTGEPLHHRPGPHWEAIDEEAKAFAAKLAHEFTGEMPDIVSLMAPEAEAAAHEKLAKAVAVGVAEAIAPALDKMAGAFAALAQLATAPKGRPSERLKADAGKPEEGDPAGSGG